MYILYIYIYTYPVYVYIHTCISSLLPKSYFEECNLCVRSRHFESLQGTLFTKCKLYAVDRLFPDFLELNSRIAGRLCPRSQNSCAESFSAALGAQDLPLKIMNSR